MPTPSHVSRSQAVLALMLAVLWPAVGAADSPATAESISHESLDRRVAEVLRAVYDRGAEQLFNQGSKTEAVYLFEGALEAIEPLLDHHRGLRLAVRKKIAESRGLPTVGHRARALREVFILIVERVENQLDSIPRPKRDVLAPSTRTIWDRMGGERGVRVMITEFLDVCLKDPRVNFTRGGRYRLDQQQLGLLTEEFVALTSAVSGGPIPYRGRPMKEAHRGMGITDKEFDALKSHLKIVLTRHDLPPLDIVRLMAVVETTRSDVVEQTPVAPRESRSSWQRLGGREVAVKVVDDFVNLCLEDRRINFDRHGKYPMTPERVRLIKDRIVELAGAVSGGPDPYTGRTMKLTHKSMGITEEEFDAARGKLKIALIRNNVDPGVIGVVMDAVDGSRSDIVEVKIVDRPAPPRSGEKPALWARLGGETKVTTIISDFIDAAIADPKVNFSRDNQHPMTAAAVAKIKQKLVSLTSAIFGGPLSYDGETMKVAHKGMAITNAEFDAALEHLRKALQKHGITDVEASQVLQAVESTRRSIVEGPSSARPVGIAPREVAVEPSRASPPPSGGEPKPSSGAAVAEPLCPPGGDLAIAGNARLLLRESGLFGEYKPILSELIEGNELLTRVLKKIELDPLRDIHSLALCQIPSQDGVRSGALLLIRGDFHPQQIAQTLTFVGNIAAGFIEERKSEDGISYKIPAGNQVKSFYCAVLNEHTVVIATSPQLLEECRRRANGLRNTRLNER